MTLHICERPFAAVALHEHTGAFRDAWAAAGVRAASIADRPSTSPPAEGSFHFIADVREWRAGYQWSIPLATANPDCHCAALGVEHASKSRFQLHTSSGALAAAVEHFCWLLGCAERVAIEQPPTLL